MLAVDEQISVDFYRLYYVGKTDDATDTGAKPVSIALRTSTRSTLRV